MKTEFYKQLARRSTAIIERGLYRPGWCPPASHIKGFGAEIPSEPNTRKLCPSKSNSADPSSAVSSRVQPNLAELSLAELIVTQSRIAEWN